MLKEKAQFPHDLANWRLEIATSHQLFVDTHLIAAITGLERRLHPAVKHDVNPLIRDFWAAYLHPQPGGGYLMYGNGWRGRLDGWDAHYLRMVEQATLGGPVVRGDEVWFYYHGQYGGIPGCPGLTQPKDKWESAIGVGICPRDRFVSLAPGDGAGEVITRPLAFTGEGALSLNGVTTAGGRIRAAVLDEAGEPLPGLG